MTFALLSLPGMAQQINPPEKIKLEGDGKLLPLNASMLSASTDSKLFAGVVCGNAFDLFVKDGPVQNLNAELGYVDTKSKSTHENTFAVPAMGLPSMRISISGARRAVP